MRVVKRLSGRKRKQKQPVQNMLCVIVAKMAHIYN